MSDDEFTCWYCKGTFIKGWSDEDAWAEHVEIFGDDDTPADCGQLCDDCFEKFMKWFHERTPEELQRMRDEG